jgi:glycosyltransferase involved in cell wall biosynthesis
MLHIGIDTRLVAYRTGGISTYMRRLVSGLEALDQHNRYTVFQSRKAASRLSSSLPEARLQTPCHHRLERLALSVELARFGLDVFHSPDFIPPLRAAKRHVITVHDLTFMHYPQYLTADARAYYNGQIQQAVRHADHILADSDSTKRDLIDLLQVPAERITVHMLGVEPHFQVMDRTALEAAQQQLRLDAGYILFVGTWEPRKNILGLLHAYRLLLDHYPDAPSVLLVGRKGWLFDETMTQIHELGLGERIAWRDDISDALLPAVYNLASMLVLPSFYEGFGFPALEAMACGTVPIVSNRSSLPEVVGEVGLMINPDDPTALAQAMQRALTDTAWKTQQIQAGLERATLFTWERTAQIARQVYEQVGMR